MGGHGFSRAARLPLRSRPRHNPRTTSVYAGLTPPCPRKAEGNVSFVPGSQADKSDDTGFAASLDPVAKQPPYSSAPTPARRSKPRNARSPAAPRCSPAMFPSRSITT